MRTAATAVPPGTGCQLCSTVYATRIGGSLAADIASV